MAEKRLALGKGLSALIPDVAETATITPTELDIDLLSPSSEQPRREMAKAGLNELAESIRAHGIIQPIVVRPIDGRFQIIAGERRWRAAQLAGLTRVPVVVRDVPGGDDPTLLELALIENIQREDLNPIEQAMAYRRLVDQFQMTHDQVAKAVGKERETISNTIRLLGLPESVRDDVAAGRLSMGHARALLSLRDGPAILEIAAQIIEHGYSVREVEEIVQAAKAAPSQPAPEKRVDPNTRAAEEQMRLSLGTRVQIVRRVKGGGSVRIDFKSEEDLQRIYQRITGE